MVKLALYRHSGRWYDYLIRLWTRGIYSHCELVMSDGLFISSSARDYGVRGKMIKPKEGHWDFIDLPFADEATIQKKYESICDKGYDWVSIFFLHFFHLGIHSKNKLNCAETCAWLLGLSNPQKYDPQELANYISDQRITNDREC